MDELRVIPIIPIKTEWVIIIGILLLLLSISTVYILLNIIG